MGYAFISYSSKNTEDAKALNSALMNRGIKTWMAPGDIPAGSKYADVITKAIKGAECLVILLTDDALNSIWVEKEVERALSYRKPVIPVALGKLELNDSFELYLGNQQIVPVRQISTQNNEFLKVVDQVKRLTETEAFEGNIDAKFKDVTGNYDNKCVLIYSLAAKRFASARLELDDVPVCCSTNNQDAWEKFQVAVDKEGWASFKAVNGRYLTVRLDAQRDLPPIRATAPRNLLWEQFKIYKIEEKYAIFARCNGQWITSRIDWEDNPLYASRTVADSWEMFDIRTVM